MQLLESGVICEPEARSAMASPERASSASAASANDDLVAWIMVFIMVFLLLAVSGVL